MQIILTNFSVNFPIDAVDSLLAFIFVETWINEPYRKSFSLLVVGLTLSISIFLCASTCVCLFCVLDLHSVKCVWVIGQALGQDG